jgi:hypothetical protein
MKISWAKAAPALAVAFVLTAAWAPAARAERPRIAVMLLDAPKVAPDLRERMTHAVHEGLLASGADVVDGMPAAATGPGGAPCEGPGCVTAVAKATVAGYVVRGTLEVEGRTYGLRLEMLDGKTGELLDSREDRCEICTESEALEMAGVSASALKVQVFKKQAALASAPTAFAPMAAPAPVAVVPSEPPPETGGHRTLGWFGVGAGAAVIGMGAWLIAINHDGTCAGADNGDRCPERFTTAAPGVASVVVGGLLAAAGALVLTGTF